MTVAIQELLSVVGPVLVLLSFFTTQRAGELRALTASPRATTADYTREALLSSALPVLTLALLGVCGDMFVRVVRTVVGAGDASAPGYAFLLVCLLLVALLCLQVFDARRAWRERVASMVG